MRHAPNVPACFFFLASLAALSRLPDRGFAAASSQPNSRTSLADAGGCTPPAAPAAGRAAARAGTRLLLLLAMMCDAQLDCNNSQYPRKGLLPEAMLVHRLGAHDSATSPGGADSAVDMVETGACRPLMNLLHQATSLCSAYPSRGQGSPVFATGRGSQTDTNSVQAKCPRNRPIDTTSLDAKIWLWLGLLRLVSASTTGRCCACDVWSTVRRQLAAPH